MIGKTFSNLSPTEIFNKFSEVWVLTTVFPQITTLPCVINSPLRIDNHPSFSIYMADSGHIFYKDFGTGEHGSLLDLLCRYWNCTFKQCLTKICDIVNNASGSNINFKTGQIKVFKRKETNRLTELQVAVRPWRDYDIKYWEDYGVNLKWLKYADVYPISHKIIIKKDSNGKSVKYIMPADKYAYAFVEKKEGNLQLKIYQPFNAKGFKWCSKMDRSVVGLWAKIPKEGDRVIICSSLKDALCVSNNLHIPTLCLQGEGYGMSTTAINELKRRYKKVFICFDTDEAGRLDGEKLSKKTGFINVVPDFGECKDFSDYYKSLEDKQEFKQLEKLFN